jgi:hypothetical protein
MTTVIMHGSWTVRVVDKSADWPQRVVVNGHTRQVIRGEVGVSATLRGDQWYLGIEHYLPEHGWRRSPYVAAEPEHERGGRTVRRVVSKDHYWPGDSSPNDLVLELESAGAALEVADLPWAADGNLSPLSTDFAAAQYIAVAVRNVGGEALGYDATLDVSDAGRNALAGHGIVVAEQWSAAALRATGQEALDRAVLLPPIEPGDVATAYFRIDGAAARPGVTAFEFEVRYGSGGRGTRRGSLLAATTVVGDPALPRSASRLPISTPRRAVASHSGYDAS